MADNIGKRMKTYYEEASKTKLVRRMPVAIRIDGKAFHTFTKEMKKPFDVILMQPMHDTMLALCENIQGCVFGYTQSDEITLILIDYKKLTSGAWFDYEVQKMSSVAASIATWEFNKAFAKNADKYFSDIIDKKQLLYLDDSNESYYDCVNRAVKKGALFDARCFNIPKEEVANLLYWRQLDAVRNSVEMVGHAHFTTKELHKKSCSEIKELLLQKEL